MKVDDGQRSISAMTSVEIKDDKIDYMYDMIKEIKNEIIGKDVLRRAIKDAISEEMRRVREEMKMLVKEAVTDEIQKVTDTIRMVNKETGEQRKSYSEAARENKEEAVLIIKPKDGEEKNSSEDTKRDVRKIDIFKIGVGITKMRKVTREAVVVGCENGIQAEKLKQEVVKDLGERYVVQAPRKRKPKIKIFDVDSEDCRNEQNLWEKIEEQNGIRKNTIQGKIMHKAEKANSRKSDNSGGQQWDQGEIFAVGEVKNRMEYM